MNKGIFLLAFTGTVISSDDLFGKERDKTLVYFQTGANYGFPSGQTHFPVIISSGPDPLLPIIAGGFDRVPSITYTTQVGALLPLSNSGVHGFRVGIGLTRRDTRLLYYDYSFQWGGRIFNREMDAVRIANTDAEITCSYLFTTGPLRLGLGLIGIAWQKKVYHDQFANGIESSVVSSSFVRLREWYPMMTASYRVWKWNHLDIALYVGLNSRGFKTSETAWWDAQVGVSVTAPWKSR